MIEEDDQPQHHDERWLVSYADFITLLFALFVLMYAMSIESSDHVNRAWTAMATGIGVRPHRGGLRPDMGDAASGGAIMTERARLALYDLQQNVTVALRAFP